MESSSSARSWAVFSSFQYRGRRRMPLNRPQWMELCMPILTLSSTLRLLNRRMFWKVRAMPALLTCTVFMLWVSTPSSRTVPRVGWYTLVSRLNTVVLPAPLGPIRPAISVRPMAMLNSLTAVRPPKSMPRCWASRMGLLSTSRSGILLTLGTGTSLVSGRFMLLTACRLLAPPPHGARPPAPGGTAGRRSPSGWDCWWPA